MIPPYAAILHIDDKCVLCSVKQVSNVFEVLPISDEGPSDRRLAGAVIRAAWSAGKPAILSIQSVKLRSDPRATES